MSNNIINNLRCFVFELRYSEAVEKFHNRMQGKRNSSQDLCAMLNASHTPHYHKMEELNRAARSLPQPIQGIWNDFYKDIRANKIFPNYYALTHFLFPLDHNNLSGFDDTDLILIDENHQGPVPLNAIRESELPHLLNQYKRLIHALDFDYAGIPNRLKKKEFQYLIYRDIRILMSRPLGRLLIDRILKRLGPEARITIHPSDRFFYQHRGESKIHSIDYSVHPHYSYQELPGGLRSLFSPPYIFLAHELLHLVHLLEGEFDHDFNPDLDRLKETNEEERRVISSAPCCSKHKPDPCNEETLREQFQLPKRRFHVWGTRPDAPADTLFQQAIAHGAHGDVRAALGRGVSFDLINKEFSNLPPDLQQPALEGAMKQRSRKRPFSFITAATV